MNEGLFTKVKLCLKEGKEDDALKYLKQAKESDPNFAEAQALEGDIYMKKNCYEEVIECFDKAINFSTPGVKSEEWYNSKGLALISLNKRGP